MEIKNLFGVQLDYWVAKAEGIFGVSVHWRSERKTRLWLDTGLPDSDPPDYSPSDNWDQGGPIIERGRISIDYEISEGSPVAASTPDRAWILGETALIAAMRALVANKFGEEVGENEAH